MSSSLKELSRRRFLRGAKNVLLPLPILNIFLNNNGTAYAAGNAIQPKIVTALNGLSAGIGGGDPNGGWGTWIFLEGNGYKMVQPEGIIFHPYKFGRDYKLRPSMDVLQNYKSDFNIITNLKIGEADGTEGEFHNRGRRQGVSHHNVGQWGLLSGDGMYRITGGGQYDIAMNNSMTSGDHFIYEKIGKKGRLFSLHVEKVKHGSGHHPYVSIKNGNSIPPMRDLGTIFSELFKSANPGGSKKVVNELKIKKQYVVDLIMEDLKKMKCKLGKEDCITLDTYAEEINNVQRQVNQLESDTDLSSCTVPTEPNINDNVSGRYGNEMNRALAINKMIALAASCNTSHVFTYGITHSRSGVNPAQFSGFVNNPNYNIGGSGVRDAHSLTHASARIASTAPIGFNRWQNSVYADLIKQFKSIKVGDGTLLDYSQLLYFVEAGYGRNFETSAKFHPHSLENMVAMNAGGAKLGVKLGQHINGGRKHPMTVMNSAMAAMKISNPRVGKVSGQISEIY